jgi:hypothetical protein
MMFPRLISIALVVSLSLAAAGSSAARASTAQAAADSPVRDAPAERRVTPRKPRVEKDDQPIAAPRAAESGSVDSPVLDRQIQSRFTLLNNCPAEVARHQRLTPAALKARRLTLRWTILPNGQVADTAVVATSPVDSRVMECVKRQMSLWSFSHPLGPLHLERPFTFQPQPQPRH